MSDSVRLGFGAKEWLQLAGAWHRVEHLSAMVLSM